MRNYEGIYQMLAAELPNICRNIITKKEKGAEHRNINWDPVNEKYLCLINLLSNLAQYIE